MFFVSCKKEEETSGNTGGGGATSYGYVTTPEGVSLKITHPDGTVENRSGDNVNGWSSGQLLNLNFYRQLSLYDGEQSWFLRYSLLQDADVDAELYTEQALYNQPFLLQWTADMDDTIVEFYAPFSDEIEGNSTGTVTLEKDVNTPLGIYEVVGTIDATFTNNGLTYTVEGNFWAEDL